MVFLASLLTPDLGIFFWTVLIFIVLWTALGKFAWNPISTALKDREGRIENSLKQAEIAHEEMASLKADHEKLLQEAKEERSRIIREAKEIKDEIISEARVKAKEEAAKIAASAKEDIQNEKMAAIIEVKNLIGQSAIDLTKGLLSRELSDVAAQEAYVAKEIENLNLN
ncbi:MAG: F0F1 ATP synthase subunit B [Chitinophagales bacterium]